MEIFTDRFLILQILYFFQNIISEQVFLPRLKGVAKMSAIDVYIEKIIELLKNCDDIALLDLIHKLLLKS